MNKIKILTILVTGLTLLNILLIAFILIGRHHHLSGKPENKNIIIKKLHFDENQIKSYDSLIELHRTEISNYENQMLRQKNNLYSLLKSDQNSMGKDSLILDIAKIQVPIENIHFNHFNDIKHLCKPNQFNAFDELMTEVADMFTNRSGKPGNRK